MLELKQTERDNEWRYKAQDEIYPKLNEDLKKFFPGRNSGSNSGSGADSDWDSDRYSDRFRFGY